jgi:hypothetical protein
MAQGLCLVARYPRRRTFRCKPDAVDVRKGVHAADGTSFAVAQAGELWLATSEPTGLFFPATPCPWANAAPFARGRDESNTGTLNQTKNCAMLKCV